jgi:hypothetical protein
MGHGMADKTCVFDFQKDEAELKQFIHDNFVAGKSDATKIRIDKNNFIIIYNKWREAVKPTILADWEIAKKNNIIDGDFYLADLLSSENKSLKEKLFVLLETTHYEFDKNADESGFEVFRRAEFSDNQQAHTQFWARYERPPLAEYWDYIIERRDLLVPQDVRERKGSFFTPKIWVELSQKYIADVLGEDWQDEYFIWDCAAGTGNLLAGLTNKYNIWASTLDKADVDVMKDRIRNGANLLEDHVFQFDFLNDDFSKLPQGLRDIINDEAKRKNLVIYINPPYAEAATTATRTGTGQNKQSVASAHKTSENYSHILGRAINELFANFFIKIYRELPGVILASFSTLKYICSQNFTDFRNVFLAEYKAGFICPASTFDNVNGQFPIGFLIWYLSNKNDITYIKTEVFDGNGIFFGKKNFYSFNKGEFFSNWLSERYDRIENPIGYLKLMGTDIQNNRGVCVYSSPSANDIKKHMVANITKNNLIQMSVYLAVRHCIEPTWLNNRDQFLYPNDCYKTDLEFQNDCLAYTLFSNNIQSKYGANHWIPFTETEVNARDKFASHFMTDFIAGKLKHEPTKGQIEASFSDESHDKNEKMPLVFSEEAKTVFEAGKELWRYYHAQPKCNVNASLYDIREHFQGRNDKGKMNSKSDDAAYTALIATLRLSLKALAKKIAPKVYQYGFLKE